MDLKKLQKQKSEPLFEPERVPGLSLKQYQPLLDLLLEPKQVLVGILCDTTDLCDGDKIAKNLFNIFEFEGKTTLLLKESIAHEIHKCTKSTLLFRNNSICSKMLTVWARLLGLDYLKQSIGKCIEDIANSSESFEVDPNRAKEEIDLRANMARLEFHLQRFFQSLCDSASYCPKQIKLICHFLQSLTTGKFPEAGYFVVAGFFFLRYVCPAIVTPPSYELLATFPKKESHRGLVLVAKVLQNLANGVDFKKEPFMQPLNPFLVENNAKFQNFINQLSSSEDPSGADLPSLNQGQGAQLTNLSELHQFLMKNITRIQELLSASQDTTPAEVQAVNTLRDLLFELERLEKADTPSSKREKSLSSTESLLFGESSPREIILNVERTWGEAVRLPVIASIDLLSRAQQICEDNPIQVGLASKAPAHSIDWQALSDSIDFSEFVLDTAELQKVDLSKLANQKEALAFWLNVANTMVIHTHVANGPPNSKSRRKTMMHTLKYEIGFHRYSLEDIIEGILRGNPNNRFKKKDPRIDFCMQHYDPRFHFGFSLLTSSSPSIRIFKPETISFQLNSAAESFLDEEVSFNDEKRKVILPQLLDKYYQDFGVFHSDIFRWLAKFLDLPKRIGIGKIVATTHYSFEYTEFNWDPKKSLLFASDSLQSKQSVSEQFALDFPTDAINQRCKESSEPMSNGADGILNLEIAWVGPARPPVELSIYLARFAQGLCNIFLFDWGSIAGSPEFKSFLLATSELQKLELVGLSFHETMAFWVNIYNILLIHLYIMKRPPGEMSSFWRNSFFTTYRYQIGKATYSLQDIEEGVIRGNVYKHFKLKDERFKFVLSTDPRSAFLFSLLTKSSPPVRIYDDVDMEGALTKSTQQYLRRTRVDLEKKKIYLPPRVKDIYENDFKKKKEELLMWLVQFLSAEQKAQLEALFATRKKISVSFDEFDWTPWPIFERI